MHKISNRIFEIFFKKTLDFLLAGFRKFLNGKDSHVSDCPLKEKYAVSSNNACRRSSSVNMVSRTYLGLFQ